MIEEIKKLFSEEYHKTCEEIQNIKTTSKSSNIY